MKSPVLPALAPGKSTPFPALSARPMLLLAHFAGQQAAS